MKAVLIPSDPSTPASWIDVDDHHRALAAAIGAEVFGMVRVPVEGSMMIVDDDGYSRKRLINTRVSGVLYPGPILGDVLLVGLSGPDLADFAAERVAVGTLLERLIGPVA